MLNKINRILKTKNKNITSALKSIFSSELVNNFSTNIEEKYLIETISRDRGIDENILLNQISEILGIEAISAKAIRDITTNMKSSSDSLLTPLETLYKLGIIPCHASDPPFVIASNTKNLNIKEFQKANIKIYLALGKDTDRAWQNFFESRKIKKLQQGSSLTFEVLTDVIIKIAKETKELGGEEFFLGLDDNKSYSFKVNEHIYKGELDIKVIQAAKNYLNTKGIFHLDCPGMNFKLKASSTSKGQIIISIINNDSTNDTIKPKPSKQKIIKVKRQKTPQTFTSKNNVILVDDDPRFLKILSNIMKEKGWTVRTATSGEEALKLALDQENPPSLLVSDINMPGISGKEVLVNIKKSLPHLPVIILTGEKDKKLESKLALLGADAFTRKQDDPSILISWCQAMVDKYQPNLPNSRI